MRLIQDGPQVALLRWTNPLVDGLDATPIHPQICPGDEVRERARDKRHQGRDVIDPSDPAYGVREDVLHDASLDFRHIVTHPLYLPMPRAHTIHPDVMN